MRIRFGGDTGCAWSGSFIANPLSPRRTWSQVGEGWIDGLPRALTVSWRYLHSVRALYRSDTAQIALAPRRSLRRARLYAVAGIDAGDRAVGQHLAQRHVDLLTQLVVRADHSDGEVPVEIGIVGEGRDHTKRSLRVNHVVPADRNRRECGRLNLAAGQRLHQVVFQHEGRGRYSALVEPHRDKRADQHADAVVGGETIE